MLCGRWKSSHSLGFSANFAELDLGRHGCIRPAAVIRPPRTASPNRSLVFTAASIRCQCQQRLKCGHCYVAKEQRTPATRGPELITDGLKNPSIIRISGKLKVLTPSMHATLIPNWFGFDRGR